MSPGNDLGLYERHAGSWWGAEDRFFRSLRAVGAFHRAQVLRAWGDRLAGARLAELGCGGGALALELAARGARVVGVDLSGASLAAARSEARRRGAGCAFLRADLGRTPFAAGSFDLAVMTDVLEHVPDPGRALWEAGRLLRPGGRLFLNTFDRTWRARLLVVGLAEGIGLVPRGTHDGRLFVRPAELCRYADEAGMVVERIQHERPVLGRTLRTWTIHLAEAERGPGFSAFLRKEAA